MKHAHLEITHYVGGTVDEVFAGFTEELFVRLSPKLPPAKLLRYDGNRFGDFVIIRLGVPPVTQEWISEITAHHVGSHESYFVDEGRVLPFPLKRWRHRHVVRQDAPDRVAIVEDITYSAGGALANALLRPLLRQQFGARGPAYRAVFGAPSGETA